MRVLIIGGTGLISTAITRQLLDRDDNVTIYTRGDLHGMSDERNRSSWH